jgi:predicted outer membrane protein
MRHQAGNPLSSWRSVMKKLLIIVLGFFLAGSGVGSNAASGSSSSTPSAEASSPTSASADDSKQFLITGFQDNQAEIALSRLALKKTANSDVTAFAKQMIGDHTLTGNEMKQLAQSKNISLPADLSTDQKAAADRLSSLSGQDFDKAYMDLNVADHEKAVAEFKSQAAQGNDSDVVALAAADAPILSLHLDLAKIVDGEVNPSAFLADAYRDGLAEIRMAQMALSKTENGDVQNFAQRMIDDHTKANQTISQLAAQKGVQLPADLSPEQQAVGNDLSALTGREFDKAYMDVNVFAHQKAVIAFKKQAQAGLDGDVKDFAAKTLPTLSSHLDAARNLNDMLTTDYLFGAYQDGKAEIVQSHLALLKTSDQDVTNFAQRMNHDHTQLNQQITQLAEQDRIGLFKELSTKQKVALLMLLTMSGSDFDKAYMDLNVAGHQKAVDETKAATQQALFSDVRNFAADILPMLEAHLAAAQQIDGRLAAQQSSSSR